MQITVPVGGTNVIPEGEGPSRNAPEAPSPLAQRKSLHTVRMAAPTAPEYVPEWQDNGQLKWVPQAPAVEEPAAEEPIDNSRAASYTGEQQPSQSYDALHREISELKQAMQLMAQSRQPQQPQQPQGPEPPDPTQFDFYDPSQVKEFHRRNNEYVQSMVQQSVQTALDPH